MSLLNHPITERNYPPTANIPFDAVMSGGDEGIYKSAFVFTDENFDLDTNLELYPLQAEKASEEFVSSNSVNQKKSNLYRDKFQLEIPPVPDFLLPHHHFHAIDRFELSFDEVKRRIEDVILNRADLSSQFLPEMYKWTIFCVCGSSCFQGFLLIYQDVNGVLVVEMQRTLGNKSSFNQLYREIEESVTGQCLLPRRQPRYSVCIEANITNIDTSSDLAFLVSMASETCLEPQCESTRTLCELAEQPSTHDALKEAGCIPALVGLVTNGLCTRARHYAILALANMSASLSCQEELVDAAVLRVILSLTVDSPVDSIIRARESARLLANLSDRLAARVVSAIGEQELRTWMDTVDSLQDTFLRQQALRIRSSLLPAMSSGHNKFPTKGPPPGNKGILK